MIFEFELFHDVEGSIIISEPIGWKTASVGLERHPKFGSLIEFYKSDFKIYGSDFVLNGGRDWVKSIESLYGLDALIGLRLRYSDNDEPFRIFFLGQVPIVKIVEEVDLSHLITIMFSPVDFWTKFVSRFELPVDIQSALSIDGDSVDVIPPIDLPLPSQVIQKKYFSEIQGYGPRLEDVPFMQYVHGTPDNVIISEIQDAFDYFYEISVGIPVEFIWTREAGTYNLNLRVTASTSTSGSGALRNVDSFNLYIRHNSTDYIFTKSDFGTFPLAWTECVLVQALTINPGDKIIFFAQCDQNFERSFSIWGKLGVHSLGAGVVDNITGLENPTFFDITAETVTPETSADGFLVHDVGMAITDRIVNGDKSFYSEYLGNPQTARIYAARGCASDNVLLRGLQLRGYTLAERSFSLSMKDWYEGFNPMYNMGIGYDRRIVDGVLKDIIEVEEYEKFFDASATSVDFLNVRKIKRYYAEDQIFNLIVNGYAKGESETSMGLNDPQLEQQRSTLFKNVGKRLDIISKFIAASVAVESTRRSVKEQSADHKFDNDVFVIAALYDAGAFRPELGSDFLAVTNLLNADTRYNIRHSCARVFERWKKYLSGMMWQYPSASFSFRTGKGNYTMTSQMTASACQDTFGGNVLVENADLPVSSDFIFIPMPYQIEHAMSIQEYETILGNKKLAVGVSQTNTSPKKFFIDKLDYKIVTGKFSAILLPKEPFNLEVPENNSTPPGRIFDYSFDDTFE
jgi:hypothetical protein